MLGTWAKARYRRAWVDGAWDSRGAPLQRSRYVYLERQDRYLIAGANQHNATEIAGLRELVPVTPRVLGRLLDTRGALSVFINPTLNNAD